MADRAWEVACSHGCRHAWLNADGPQCDLRPHDYKTHTQRAIVRWLTNGCYWQCPGFWRKEDPADE